MLTIDEAIFFFRRNNTSIKHEYWNGERTTEYRVCQFEIDALEKQIVKEPVPITDKDNAAFKLGCTHKCKNCNAAFIDWENNSTKYCGNCGQRLKEDK